MLEIGDQRDGARSRDQHADAIGGDEIGHAGRLVLGRQIFDAEGVDDDVLGGRGGRHDHRGERHHQRRLQRVLDAEQDDRRHQQDLREHEPAAPVAEQAAEDRHLKGIDDGRPEELDGVGHADEREEADRAKIDADVFHPQEQRRAGQRERQARGEAEQKDDEDARIEENGGRAGQPLAKSQPSGSLCRRHRPLIAAKAPRVMSA